MGDFAVNMRSWGVKSSAGENLRPSIFCVALLEKAGADDSS